MAILRKSMPFALFSLLALAACAPAPIYPQNPTMAAVAPRQVAQTPERFKAAEVVWGGRIIHVRNLPDHTEVQILAYPLDASQRPQPHEMAQGRFIAVLPGYVERFDYPQGHLVTVHGNINGARSGRVGEAPYVFPLLQVEAAHVWSAEELRSNKPDIHLGLGIGIGL